MACVDYSNLLHPYLPGDGAVDHHARVDCVVQPAIDEALLKIELLDRVNTDNGPHLLEQILDLIVLAGTIEATCFSQIDASLSEICLIHVLNAYDYTPMTTHC